MLPYAATLSTIMHIYLKWQEKHERTHTGMTYSDAGDDGCNLSIMKVYL